MSRNERILRELCDQSKRNNIHIIGVPEEEEREKGIESVFTMEAHRTPERQHPKRTTPRHIIIKMAKVKDRERVLKASRESKKGHLQRQTHQAIIRLLNRNLTGQKRMA